MSVKFGTAGTGDSFAAMGYKKTVQIGEYLKRFDLDAFEYQCGRGVRVNENTANELKSMFEEYAITLSLHAPYFISLSSVEEEKRINSVNYILQSAKAVDLLGGERIVVHSGSCSKMSRAEATELAKSTLILARKALVENGFEHIRICPETMGKINQLGTLDEVIQLCKADESFIPCVDFGHLNARTLGGIKTKSDYENIFDSIENELGTERLQSFHIHFSKIEYTNGGERKHLTFEDTEYGPDFEPLLEIICEKNLSPVIICESDGTQTEDAATMKQYAKNITH